MRRSSRLHLSSRALPPHRALMRNPTKPHQLKRCHPFKRSMLTPNHRCVAKRPPLHRPCLPWSQPQRRQSPQRQPSSLARTPTAEPHVHRPARFAAHSTSVTPVAPITYRSVMRGADRALWNTAAAEEFVRLVDESRTLQFIPPHEKPRDRLASYYNPQVKIKIKEGNKDQGG
jgi:hypothetical protein